MSHRQSSPPQRRLGFGLLVISVGVLALLNNLGVFQVFGVLQFWPVAFMLLGAWLLLRGGHARRYLNGSALLALGALMTLDHAGIVSFSLRQWWPLLLIYAGLMLLLRGGRGQQGRCVPPAGQTTQRDGRLHSNLVMSSSELVSEAQDFQGGRLQLVMSGLKLDLRQAVLHGEAVLEVEMMLSGLEIRVPPDWTVTLELSPLMGGVDDKSAPPLQRDKRLLLRGEVVMSGIEIRN